MTEEEVIYEEEEEEEEAPTPSTLSIEIPKRVVYEDPRKIKMRNIVDKFRGKVTDVPTHEHPNGQIEIKIPSFLLPITLRVAFGFSDDDILFNITLMLRDYSWTTKPVCEIINPSSQNYCGKCLVEDAKDKFFSSTFKPKSNYRSAPIFLVSNKPYDDSIVERLTDVGFTTLQSIRAASLLNDFEQSVTFLQTGQYPQNSPFPIPLSYDECPLLYFILEIFDSVLDLQDHCCICGKKISAGLRANICDDELCRTKFIDIGVGMTLSKEINKDPAMADLLFSVFSFQQQTKYFNPKPPMPTKRTLEDIIEKMPAMRSLGKCRDDREVFQKIGQEAFNILKWVILTCRSNFLSLPPSLEFSSFRRRDDVYCQQFMALTATPEQEMIFQQMKKKYGSRFMWHGSPTIRWHTIIREGLKNFTGNDEMTNVGQAYGRGIYFAPIPQTSIGYTRPTDYPDVRNKYKNSTFGDNFTVVSLVEVINLPLSKEEIVEIEFNGDEPGTKIVKKFKGLLIDHGYCFTLQFDEIGGNIHDLASIVRFLFVNLPENAPETINEKYIPTLNQVLSLRANIK